MANELDPTAVEVQEAAIERPLPQYYASVFGVGRTPFEFIVSFGKPVTAPPSKIGAPVPIALDWTHSVILSYQATIQLRDALNAHIEQLEKEARAAGG